MCWPKRASSWRLRPKSLARRIPETDSVSWVTALTSAIVSWASAVTRRRRSPTILANQVKTGMVSRVSTVSCQESTAMATRALAMITTLERMSDSVEVTTVCTPPTSLVSRDWISPVRVSVKKRSDRCWRCSKRRSRRSRITRWPTRLARQVWISPTTPPTTGRATMTAVRTPRRARSGPPPPAGNRAVSKTTLMSNGLTTPTPAPTRTRTTMATTSRR